MTCPSRSLRDVPCSFHLLAERYHREQYPKINEMLSHLLENAPAIRTFDVHTSTTHRVVAGKAA
jgi:hypothetical protein